MGRRCGARRSCGKCAGSGILCNPCFNKRVLKLKCSWEEALRCMERFFCRRR